MHSFLQTNFNTTLDRALILAIICGMGLDGGQIRNGDHTWMVSKNTCYVLGKSNHAIAD